MKDDPPRKVTIEYPQGLFPLYQEVDLTEPLNDAEKAFYAEAEAVAAADASLAQEYLLYIAGGTPTWQAQKQAETSRGREVTLARARYEIALERMKRF